jgi:hypothetical protein
MKRTGFTGAARSRFRAEKGDTSIRAPGFKRWHRHRQLKKWMMRARGWAT